MAKSRYTLGGWLMPEKITEQRIYEPSYHLASLNPPNFDHIQLIIRNCVLQTVEKIMPTYDVLNVNRFVRSVSNDIKFRIQIQNFDRFRTVVITNVTEKAEQGINWQVGTLFDPTNDGWTSFEYETPTFHVNVIVLCVYYE